ncbi:MAG: DeoR/GlpR family DNA-binding transcription regulator [Clostridiales bacterium]|nr:DeoR/GlpR family DNA-binding transcription regulator [Clostridiales bacterium]
MKKQVDRTNQLIEILYRKQRTTIKELASLLQVSEMTIRRDLEILKGKGIVANVRGSVLYETQNLLQVVNDEYSLMRAGTAHVKEKEKIGVCGASLIELDDCIIIDNGTTTEHIADYIPNELRLTILSCNLNIINKVCDKPNIRLIFGGGYFHSDTYMFESAESVSLIKRTRASKVFVSAAGVHESLGVTCTNNYELHTKQAILESGAERILVLDSSKFGIVKSCYFADIADFNKIITDKNLPVYWQELITEKGISLIMV